MCHTRSLLGCNLHTVRECPAERLRGGVRQEATAACAACCRQTNMQSGRSHHVCQQIFQLPRHTAGRRLTSI